MRRTAQEAELTRQRLLEAALLGFAEKGWQGVTYVGVAQSVGLTRGAVHHHFASKEELLEGVLEWGWGHYGKTLVPSELQADPEKWMTRLIGGMIALMRDDPRFRALVSVTVLVAPQSTLSLDPKHRVLDGWRDEIASVVAQAKTSLEPITVANLVLTLLQGLTLTAVTRPDDLPRPESHDDVVAALVKTLLS